MQNSASASNQQQRQAALAARRKLSSAQRSTASALITRNFCESRAFRAAKSVACYFPMHDEVDTSEIFERAWRAGKDVYVPVIHGTDNMSFARVTRESTLKKNIFGIWEPLATEEINARLLDIVVTPLVAFDKKCQRIGMGGGYYDRCFRFLRTRRVWLQPKLIGLAFACQKVAEIRSNPWDIPLYAVFSDT